MSFAIEKACALMGGQAALARSLKVTTPAVNQWISGIRPVPIMQCVAIEKITDGAVTRKELRPDDWMDIWPELSNAA